MTPSDDLPNNPSDDDALLAERCEDNAHHVADLLAVDTVIAYGAARSTFERLLVVYTGWLTRVASTLASDDPAVATELMHAGADALWELCCGGGSVPRAAVVYRTVYSRLVTDLRTLRRAGVARSTWGRGCTRLPYLPSSSARQAASGLRAASPSPASDRRVVRRASSLEKLDPAL